MSAGSGWRRCSAGGDVFVRSDWGLFVLGGENIYRCVESALYVPGYFANIAFVCRDWVMRCLPTPVNNPVTYNSIPK